MSDLVTCYRCGALYRKGYWSIGYHVSVSPTAPSKFRPIREVPHDECPICLKPPQRKPTPEVRPM